MQVNFDYYQNFTGEQFAADEFFQQWVLSPDREKERFWKTYLYLHPGQRNPFLTGLKEVKELAKAGYYRRPLSIAEKRAIKEELFRYFELNALPIPPIPPSKVIPIPGRKPLRRVIAAGAVGLILLPAWLLSECAGNGPQTSGIDEMVIQHTKAKEIKGVVLTDSSIVTLKPNELMINEAPAR